MDVLTLEASDVDLAGGVIARAFHHDPLNVHLFPDDTTRARLAPSTFAAFVRLDRLFGQVDCLPGLAGVASWVRPGETVETPERLAQAGFGDLSEDIPLGTLDTVFGFIAPAVARVAPEPHWHLRLLGVEPGRQGEGLGAVLLQTGLARAAEGGHPVLLETFAERNLPFYVRHGFELLVEDVEPSTGLRFWALRHSAGRRASG